MAEEPLEFAEVRKNLDWRWSWHGITPAHFGYATVPAVFIYACALCFRLDPPVTFCVILAAISSIFVGVFQFNRPPDHLLRAIALSLEPSYLSPFKDPVRRLGPFPVDKESVR